MTKLFEDFPEVSAKAWKQKIQADLKGADYNDTLIWKTNEGIDVKPFYHPDSYSKLNHTPQTKATSWHICQTIYVQDLVLSNKIAHEAINQGVESIKFIIPTKTISITDLLNNIEAKSIYLECLFLDQDYVNSIIEKYPNIYILTDIIGHLARTGNWYHNLNDDHDQFKFIFKSTNQFSVDISLYQNAGATMVQQLAYALAQCSEYLNYLDHQNLVANKTLTITFNIAVGSNYFFEIAKIRALRALVTSLSETFNCNLNCHVFATPSKRNKTLYDYNTNMLRSTTECMSAILGGANSICNLAYDAIYHKNNAFGDRISRNQLLVLKHESYFNTVNNPADGSYYIETITLQLAEKALELFKDTEKNGGLLSQLKTGTIQRKIKESGQKEQSQFDDGSLILVGSNKYQNPDDLMKNDLELYPFVKTNPRKTLIEPIIENRLSETLEQERLKTE